MKLKPIKKEYLQVLDRIGRSIPKEWSDNITKKVMLAPKYAKLVRDIAGGIDNPDIDNSRITPRQIEQSQAIIDSGEIKEFEKMVEVENIEVTRKIDRFVEDEIIKATARGELPKGKKFRNLSKKIKKQIYARSNK